jgi:hypothetical protein
MIGYRFYNSVSKNFSKVLLWWFELAHRRSDLLSPIDVAHDSAAARCLSAGLRGSFQP